MLRAPRLSAQCLACQVPLAGPLSWPARLFGIHRNSENPNLCSRCGYHLSVGEIRPTVHVLLELGDALHFGAVRLDQLSEQELPALIQQLRKRLEDNGALILPGTDKHPLRVAAYFNAPVQVEQPALHALKAVQAALGWLGQELDSLSIECGWRAILASGFVEVVACEGPMACFPLGEVTFRAADQLNQVPSGQLACDFQTYIALASQDEVFLQSLLGSAPEPLPPDGQGVISLLDSSQDGIAARPSRQRLLSAASTTSQFGALLLALIAAPCAAMVVFSPVAVAVGLGASFAVLLPLWKVIGMSFWPRILITVGAVLVASLNLIRAELAQKRFRQLQRQVGAQLSLPRSQRRRLRSLRWSSVMILAVVLLEGLLRVFVMQMPLF